MTASQKYVQTASAMDGMEMGPGCCQHIFGNDTRRRSACQSELTDPVSAEDAGRSDG